MSPQTEKMMKDIAAMGKAVFPLLLAIASALFAAGAWWSTQANDKGAVTDRLKAHEEMINELKVEMKGQRMYIDTRLNDISRDIQQGNTLTAKMSGQMEILLRRSGATP